MILVRVDLRNAYVLLTSALTGSMNVYCFIYICTNYDTGVDTCKSNQGNQGYSGNQKNVIQEQRPDMENRHTKQRT